MALAALLVAVLVVPQGGPLQVEITPKDKPAVSARWTATSLAIDTQFGTATVKPDRLEQIVFGDPDVVIAAGVELRGKLKLTALDTKVDGKARKFPTKELASLVVLRDGKALGAPSFDGAWMTSFGPMQLAQKGLTVTGTSGFDGKTEIEGKIEKGVLRFRYRGENSSGQGKLELLPKDDAFNGSYEASADNQGFWGGYRKASKRAEVEPGKVATGQVDCGMRYCVRLPKAHAADKKWPAICILHGSNMDSRAYVDTIVSTWPELAEQYAIVGLDGEQLSPASKPGALRFNYTYINFSGPKVGPSWVHRQSPALVADTLQQLGKELPVTKWFLGGHSQGGFLAYCLVMFFPETIAGAFPMSCNLLVQCEPDNFDATQAAAQHGVAVAVIHGKSDNVVEYSGGAYCHLRMIDGGFPCVRLFAPERIGHEFALLPVDQAVRWLAAMTADDPAALVASAEKAAEERRWRDAGALCARLSKQKPAAELQARADAVATKLAAAAEPAAHKLGPAIEKDGGKGGKWIDDFLAFRRDFATADAAAPVLAAYDKLREAQKKQGDELFGKWRGAETSARKEIAQQIFATCYATRWYEAVKLWTK